MVARRIYGVHGVVSYAMLALSFTSFLGLFLAGCVSTQSTHRQPETSAAAAELDRLQKIAQRVEIIRDDFGVPHIYGKTDADAVFGLLYAQAEDDFPRVERNYVWALGRLAEVEGESALFSDVRARLYMTIPEARDAYERAPEWLQQLCRAFADGLNFYLATHPEVTPRLLTQFEPWMPMFFFEGSIGGDIEQIPLAGIKAFYSGAKPQAVANEQVPLRNTLHFREPIGSNGIAIAPGLSQSGNALLLINPHTSFFFRGEVHVVSEEGLNAYGAVTWGQFFVYQGFNEQTGWMHTSTKADFMDEFVQTIVRHDDHLSYRYGDDLRDLEIDEIRLKMRMPSGQFEQRSFPRYRTHQGPITHALDDGRWVSSRINWQPAKALAQSYLRMKQTGYDGFRKMMDMRTNSSNNTVYADDDGNIGYFHGNFMPRRSAKFDYSLPVDGSNPATDWQGLHALEEVVHLLNPANGWLQNCNSTPFTAAAQYSPKARDYPAYMAPDAENFRGVHAQRVLGELSEQVSNGGDKLTLDGLLALAYDPQLPGFERLLGGLFDAWDDTSAQLQAELALAEPIKVLRDWNMQTASHSVAMSLAHFYGLNMLETVEAPSGLTRMERTEWMGTQSKPEDRLQALAQSVQELNQKFGRWTTPWGQINRYQRLDGEIEQRFDDGKPSIAIGLASGNWGALASFGAPRRGDVDRLYGRYGNSFVAVVEFGDRLSAKTLLAGGQSSNPLSAHFADQSQRYADIAFKTVAFYREDVERRGDVPYHPGAPLISKIQHAF